MLGASLVQVREYLRETLGVKVPRESIEVTPDGRPHPRCGQVFIAIYGSDYSFGPAPQMDMGMDVIVGFTCAVTFRTPFVPRDRVGKVVYSEQFSGMEELCRTIMYALHRNYELAERINGELERLGYIETLVQPFEWLRTSPQPTIVGSECFSRRGQATGFEHDEAGAVMEVEFGNGRFMAPLRGF